MLRNLINEITNDLLINVKIKINVAGGIVYRYNTDIQKYEVLLIQRSKTDFYPNIWEFPRGKCDKGDKYKIKDCLRREIKEETGLEIKIQKYIDKFDYIADKGRRISTIYIYLCKQSNINQNIKLSHEHQAFQWISDLSVCKLLLMPDMYKILEKSQILGHEYSNKKIKIDDIEE